MKLGSKFRVELVLPRLTVKQRWTTGVLCGLATTIWTVPSWYAPWADVSGLTLTAGAAIPAGVAWVWHMGKGWTDRNDAREAAALREAQEFAARRAAERAWRERRRYRFREVRPGEVRVIDGEVLPR